MRKESLLVIVRVESNATQHHRQQHLLLNLVNPKSQFSIKRIRSSCSSSSCSVDRSQMGTHTLLLLLLLFLFHASHASSFFSNHRKLVTSSDSTNNKTQTPPIDSPPPSEKKESDPIPTPVAGETKNNKEGSNNSNKDGSAVPPDPTPLAPKVENKKGKTKEKEMKDSAPPANAPPPPTNAPSPPTNSPPPPTDGPPPPTNAPPPPTNGSQSITNESCDGLNKCKDDGDMVACISIIDPKYLAVLIQNNGDVTIKVKPLVESYRRVIEVAKHQTEKINISLISSEITQLTLTAGKGNCVLHMDTVVPKAKKILRLPSFDNIWTPVNGAYFLIFAVIVFGGTWGCCKLRKKRHVEVPYQELEMALPETASATNVESAEGWDQVWDDDWDDNVAVKSPVAHHARSISANGLTSRSANKDGWENNWDD